MVVPLKHDAASLMLFSATTNLQICVSNLKIRPRRSHGNFLSSPSTPAAPPPIRPTRHQNTPPPHQASTSCYLQPLSKAVPLAAISRCWAAAGPTALAGSHLQHQHHQSGRAAGPDRTDRPRPDYLSSGGQAAFT